MVPRCVLLPLFAILASPMAAFGESPSSAYATFLGTLSKEERAAAVKPFSDVDRREYRPTPGLRGGLALQDMDPETRKAAFGVLESLLTPRGMVVVRAAINRKPWFRYAEIFYLAIFGNPKSGMWGVRFEGHHLSVNLTLDGDRLVAVTPLILGANSRERPDGTADPILPFVDALDDRATFLAAAAKLFSSPDAAKLLEDAKVWGRGYEDGKHPHMYVNGSRDFGGS